METQSSRLDSNLEERKLLFEKYIVPNLDYIKRLVNRYTYNKSNVDDYYSEALENFFKYILSYDPAKPLHTWIHIVIRRFCQELARKEDIYICHAFSQGTVSEELYDPEDISYVGIEFNDYDQFLSDDVYNAINSLKPIYRESLLLQVAGYTLEEITDKLYDEGKLKNRNIETVKSRVFLGKMQLRKLITRDGHERCED